jgi:RimJ/RimL family protein N-acetyltransferase
MTAPPILTGRAVRLRPWRADDVDTVLLACQDAGIQRWTEVPVPYLREHAESFVGEVAARTWSAGGGPFAVETVERGQFVGAMTLFPPRNGVGAAGYWTAPEHRGRGCTAEALALLCGWAFDVLGLRRVELVADPANTGSRRVAERVGFRAEGVLRQRSLHRGVPVDDMIYGLLAGDARFLPTA